MPPTAGAPSRRSAGPRTADSMAPIIGSDQVKSASNRSAHHHGEGEPGRTPAESGRCRAGRSTCGCLPWRSPCGTSADDRLDPLVPRGDDLLGTRSTIPVAAARGGGLSRTACWTGRSRQIGTRRLLRLVGEQRPQRPGAARRRRAIERGVGQLHHPLHVGDVALGRPSPAARSRRTSVARRQSCSVSPMAVAQGVESRAGFERDGRNDLRLPAMRRAGSASRSACRPRSPRRSCSAPR